MKVNVVLAQSLSGFGERRLVGDFVADALDPGGVAFLQTDPVVFGSTGHEGGIADLFGEVQADETRIKFGGLDQIAHPQGDVAEPRHDFHGCPLVAGLGALTTRFGETRRRRR